MIRKPYPPGMHGQKRRRTISEYGRQLREKQKIKALYGLGERQLRRYVASALKQRDKTVESLLSLLERRLDNVLVRLGLTSSLGAARQLAAHGHFLVNKKRVNVPSYPVSTGDIVSIRPASAGRNVLRDMPERLKKYTPPAWLALNRETREGRILREPSLEDLGALPANIQAILEYYSR
jgi:small subunit ribosomal protein S4